ncbi:hypothetical protein DICPUDRAFT_146631 [Dictyostelium purpureum]|uniref:Uncharacterized protein n=1 Tax=Dictyostelium purpureum TaxID=5786 RepID=F0Z6G9_DICPU|nr:uncharacterized protein DICPUDRAFT_146631 [Dictyostelium purpureum]EGC40488.1 hypothetical protein DICPUDRAFT_146631 [Dictyostelium purpureum]|eukprot:XP_003283035.1 hypothetical protein DICPUDRAFT_146631 [Dictyostelium purpureum]
MSFEVLDFIPDSEVNKKRLYEPRFSKRVEENLKKLTIDGDITPYKEKKKKEHTIIDPITKNPVLKKLEKNSILKLLVSFKKGSQLNIRKNRLFKFDVSNTLNDDSQIFLDPIDHRFPDFSQIFLNRFSVSNCINHNPFPIVLHFSGLPKSLGLSFKEKSFNILVPSNTTSVNCSSVKQHLVNGSKKKSNGEDDPIPKPIFESNKIYSHPSIYPTELLLKETPHAFVPCQDTDFGRTCESASLHTNEKYHLFNIFNFCVEVEKSDGSNFKKEDNALVSFEIELKYYFLHYFSGKDKLMEKKEAKLYGKV